MKHQVILLCLLCLFTKSNTSAQSPIFVKNKTSKSFLTSKTVKQHLDIDHIDLDLLKTTIFHLLNSKSKVEFEHSNKPATIAEKMLISKRGFAFKPNIKRKKQWKRSLQKERKQRDYHASYVDLSFDYLPVLNFKTSQKYLFSEQTASQEQGFYYPSKSKKKAPVLIPNHTYLSFAKTLLKRLYKTRGNSILTSKQYQELGLAIQIEQKTENRMPYLKVFWIAGGYRLKLLRP